MAVRHRGVRTLVAVALLAPASAAAQKVPVAQLKLADGKLAEEFTLIASVRELSDGRILVSDEKEKRLVIADLRSGAVAAIGRVGSGPGEYRGTARLWALSADSTMMADQFGRRWLLLNGAEVALTLPSETPAIRATFGMVSGVDRNGHVLALRPSLDPTGRPMNLEDSLLVVRVERASGRAETLARVPSPFAGGGRGEVAAARQGGAASERRIYVVAISAYDQTTMFPDGWIAIARVSPYRVDWCAPNGTCTTGPTLPATVIKMTNREKHAFLDLAAKTTRWPPTSAVEEVTGWPDAIPPFVVPPMRMDASALVASPDGRLLIERMPSADAPPTRYDIVDRRGELVGQLSLLWNERIVGFGAKSVYVAVTDHDGIQRLRRHPWP
ncbi:MAG TPA: hypothetical protein VJL28_03895 [Gemmatimonadaceae bacterium]|nr:hypothetical protein [Gemmatimonadaceae bacterium]